MVVPLIGKSCSDDLVSFPASRFHVRKVLGWVWLLRVAVLAHVRVGVFVLIEVTEGVVYFAVLALVSTN